MADDKGNVDTVVNHLKDEIGDKSLQIAILRAKVEALSSELNKNIDTNPKLPLESNDE